MTVLCTVDVKFSETTLGSTSFYGLHAIDGCAERYNRHFEINLKHISACQNSSYNIE